MEKALRHASSLFSTTTLIYHRSEIIAATLLYLLCCVPLEEGFRVLFG